MKNNFLIIVSLLFTIGIMAQSNKVQVVSNEEGMKLVVNGEDFMINGMNWDYIPIFWNKSDDVIKAGLDTEMSLLKNMNVNAVRMYTGAPARWIRYIYENYGIYTLLTSNSSSS